MSGTYLGGLKAAKTNVANDPDFYKKLGALGGAKPHRHGKYPRCEACGMRFQRDHRCRIAR